MNQKEIEKQIIEQFQQDEEMMILVFAQWCVNHDLDPMEVYLKAYPDQLPNARLQAMIQLAVPKHESEEIADATLLGVLDLYGNTDLADVIQQEIRMLSQKQNQQKRSY
ncbi:hypothetical protein [Marinicrinis sediminis]|uniref:Uncharacterized protein n=1 Tax=Marinicrinis sediminis TaxID=1652465 RepID=A0ABW5RCF1_9BACL